MLDCSEYLTTDKNERMYDVVFRKEGVFEPKETGTSLIREDDSVIYASLSFEITLDQIAADIKKADELYGDENANAVDQVQETTE